MLTEKVELVHMNHGVATEDKSQANSHYGQDSTANLVSRSAEYSTKNYTQPSETDLPALSPVAPTGDGEPQWLRGCPLLIVMLALTIVCYLMLLDVSIVSTVRGRLPDVLERCQSKASCLTGVW